jgi:hypothetical protein
MTTTEFED